MQIKELNKNKSGKGIYLISIFAPTITKRHNTMKEQEKTDVQNAEVTSNAQKEFPTYDKDFFEQEVKRFLEQHQKELQCLDTMKISNNTKRLIECSYQVNLLCNEISGFLYHYYGDKEG